MLKFGVLYLVICISTVYARRFHRQTDGQGAIPPARPPPPPNPPSPPPFLLNGTNGTEQVVPDQVQQRPVQPFAPPLQQQIQPSLALQQPQDPPLLEQIPVEKKDEPPRRHFAPGFEPRPIPPDPGLNQAKIQWFGDPLQASDPASLVGENLAVIRNQEQQLQGKEQQLTPLQQQLQNANIPLEQFLLRQRIQAANFNSRVNTAGRDREAFLARVNVTGDPNAARVFIKQLQNLTSVLEKQPFITVDLMKDLLNIEIQLAVDNWIINEEVAGQIAATFKIPRESASIGFSLTGADVDEMHISGNNPTAAKRFLVQLRELVYLKIDNQYRITTDLLASFSDAMLNLLVGNGIVKEKFADDIAAYFYRANNRKIKLF